MTKAISVRELTELLAKNSRTVLLDVRRKGDFEQSPQKITGADWHDPEDIENWIASVPTDQEVVTYCVKGGMVSQSVTEKLAAHGCRVKYLDGGIKAWQESGGGIE